MTLSMIVIVPPLAIGAVVYGRFLKTLSLKTQAAVGQMSAFATTRLAAGPFRTITAYNMQIEEGKKFGAKVDDIYRLAMREALVSATFFGTTGFAGESVV